jgi:hypothetical protein
MEKEISPINARTPGDQTVGTSGWKAILRNVTPCVSHILQGRLLQVRGAHPA